MNSTSLMVVSQLLAQSPVLLAYIAGIVVCAVCWRRAPMPAALAMAGSAIFLVSTLLTTLIPGYLIGSRAGGPSAASLSTTLAVVGIGTGILRAAGFVMLLAAVFVQRRPDVVSGFEVHAITPRGSGSEPMYKRAAGAQAQSMNPRSDEANRPR